MAQSTGKPSSQALGFRARNIRERSREERALNNDASKQRHEYVEGWGPERGAIVQLALDAAGAGTWRWNPQTNLMAWDPVTGRLFGLSPDEGSGPLAGFLRRVHAHDRPRMREALAVARGTPSTHEAKFRIRLRDGRIRYLCARGHAVPGDPQAVSAVVGLVWDETATQRLQREHAAIVGIAEALRALDTEEEIARVGFEHIHRALEAPHALITLQQAEAPRVVVRFATGRWSGLVDKDATWEEGIIGWVFATQRPYTSTAAAGDPKCLRPEVLRGLQGVAALPMLIGEDMVGVLACGRAEPFDDEDLAIAASLTNVVATAIGRLRHRSALERRLRELVILHTIDVAMTNTLDLSFVLEQALQLAVEHLGVDAAAVHLLDQETNRLTCRAALGFRTVHIWHSRPALGEGLLGSVALERAPIFLVGRETLLQRCKRHRLVEEENFAAYGGFPLAVRGEVVGVLEIFHRESLEFRLEWKRFGELIAGQLAVALQNATLYSDLEHLHAELLTAYDSTIEGWARALESRDVDTERHCVRVAELAVELAMFVGYSAEQLTHLRRGALLHDIGKIAVPDAILRKPGPLTPEEWALMREHPRVALEILRPIKFLAPALDVPGYHHERWDGGGYPFGLAGSAIPHPARLFAVVDVYDALTSDRPYRKAWPPSEALAYIATNAGAHFDPDLAHAFLQLMAQKGIRL